MLCICRSLKRMRAGWISFRRRRSTQTLYPLFYFLLWGTLSYAIPIFFLIPSLTSTSYRSNVRDSLLFPLLCHLGIYGLGVRVAVISADVFYQVKVGASSFLPSLGHLPIYYYLICTICPFWGQHWVLVDLSLHLKSINCGWELMDSNGLSQRNVTKHLPSGLQASFGSEEKMRCKWNVMKIHEWGSKNTNLIIIVLYFEFLVRIWNVWCWNVFP